MGLSSVLKSLVYQRLKRLISRMQLILNELAVLCCSPLTDKCLSQGLVNG